jgi:hypothetical protein
MTYTAKEDVVVCGILDIILKKKTFKLGNFDKDIKKN